MKSRFVKALSLFLALLLAVSMIPFTAAYADTSSSSDTVDIFYEYEGTSSYYTVQLGASKNLNGCKKCVTRMRDLGYNAFLYQAKNSDYYRLCVGVFSSANSAKPLSATIRDLAPIKGTKAESAYATTIKLSKSAADKYSNYNWSTSDKPPVADDDIDVFYETDSDARNKVCTVQVGATTSLSSCKTCVERLRERGYNAFIYQKKGSNQYRVVIGAFSSSSKAQPLADSMRAGGKIKGMKTESAYVTNIYLSDSAKEKYGNYFW